MFLFLRRSGLIPDPLIPSRVKLAPLSGELSLRSKPSLPDQSLVLLSSLDHVAKPSELIAGEHFAFEADINIVLSAVLMWAEWRPASAFPSAFLADEPGIWVREVGHALCETRRSRIP